MVDAPRLDWRIAVVLALFCWTIPAAGDDRRRPLSSAEEDFLTRHWRRPLAPQGPAPPRFSAIEKSLASESCGSCHPAQFADWTTSLHARSMGPGVMGQLAGLIQTDDESARLCLGCHAPLAEQQPKSPAFDQALQQRGLVCAACHVRRHERFGPPRRDGSLATAGPRAALPHNGVTRSRAFLRSEFCASCHQFTRDGFALNGKLLENTYEEWKASAAARQNIQCQDCHMPDRRHLWRGIHDPEMTKSGVAISLVTDRSRYRVGDHVTTTLTIVSKSVGHYLPTYVTPRIVMRARLVDSTGRTVVGSLTEKTIGRDVELDLSRELGDTRIPPGGRAVLEYRRLLDRAGLRLIATVTVEPDRFYTRFFASLLAGPATAETPQLHEALDATRRSSFDIFTRDIPLT